MRAKASKLAKPRVAGKETDFPSGSLNVMIVKWGHSLILEPTYSMGERKKKKPHVIMVTDLRCILHLGE